MVVDITSCDETARRQWFEAWFLNRQHSKDAFHVDFYPFVVGEGKDFSAFFQYVRVEDAFLRGLEPSVRKGILRVVK